MNVGATSCSCSGSLIASAHWFSILSVAANRPVWKSFATALVIVVHDLGLVLNLVRQRWTRDVLIEILECMSKCISEAAIVLSRQSHHRVHCDWDSDEDGQQGSNCFQKLCCQVAPCFSVFDGRTTPLTRRERKTMLSGPARVPTRLQRFVLPIRFYRTGFQCIAFQEIQKLCKVCRTVSVSGCRAKS